MAHTVRDTLKTAKTALCLMWRRPGSGSLVILLGAFLIPPPVRSGNSSSLLGLPTLCPLRAATGVPCPGCGITRALCLCAHGRFVEAVTVYHPVVPLVFLGLIAAAGYGLCRGKPLPDRVTAPFAYGTAALLLGVWVARMTGWLPVPPR
ncbi:MAG: DUF2752 domain-containing protein [Armatimonadetes bacterium]|nr:DUF2752 domain-containing protein [Armatimonadota bacterium]